MTLQASIADSLIDAFPSATYGLPALLQLAQIVETTAVKTAGVECSARPRLFINPEFVAKHADTPEKLAMLVMHELHHVILGHTRLYPRSTPLDNLVFDAVINAMLCRLLPEPHDRELFIDFYREDRFPECFLRPGPGWSPCEPTTACCVPSALLQMKERRSELADLHARLYSVESVCYDELRDALSESVPPNFSVELLGDHGASGEGSSSDGDLEMRSPELLEHIRRIVERWPQPPTPLIGRSLSEFVKRSRTVVPPPSKRTQLIWLLRRIAGARGSAPMLRQGVRAMPIESPLPVVDRRATVLTALGKRPMFYRHELPRPHRRTGGELVHLYVDVSGSMSSVLGPLYRAVIDCDGLIHRTVHLFSTSVVDVGIERVRRGEVQSTGGTSIECVAEHIRASGVRRAVIVTDGFVGAPGATALATLKACRLGVALLGPATHRADLISVADHWLSLTGGAQ